MNNSGILYGVGVGPGDPELITVKALKTISACRYVAYIDPGKGRRAVAFEIARAAMPEIEEKERIPVTIPMTADKALMSAHHRAAFDTIGGALLGGDDVAFLSLGDISVYSTFGYLRRLAREAGFTARMVSGVPSFCAAAAALDTDLVLGERNLHVFCASDTNLDAFLSLEGTRVLMKGPESLPRILETLKERGLDAALVSNCGMENELVVRSVKGLDGTGSLSYYSLVITGGEEA
ncbi:MAG: precorrin-2 C(20)-methyltransferase [Spirochaetaceae bacterium]|jgi:precorrin-2/cobalt-factor-2 C20-methyltransferase|nr:precorrin-2 C(20)-methyltransferase [Spirochaetaceae bacterium]